MRENADAQILANNIADICAEWLSDDVSDSRAMFRVLAQLTVEKVSEAQARQLQKIRQAPYR